MLVVVWPYPGIGGQDSGIGVPTLAPRSPLANLATRYSDAELVNSRTLLHVLIKRSPDPICLPFRCDRGGRGAVVRFQARCGHRH